MKKYIAIILFITASMAAFGSSEELDIYSHLYNSSRNPVERYGILQSVAEAKIAGAGELYASALNRLLLESPTIRSTADREATDLTARLLTTLLGEEKFIAAAGDVWKTVEVFSNPLVKSDALIALGRMRATDYLPQVIRVLSDLNLRPTADRDAGEKTAFGAIISLEKYQDPAGYLPVFFASNGWYSKRIKEQAIASLPYILEDPSEPLTSVITASTYTYDVKYLALQKADESGAANESKASVALKALSEGWRSSTSDPRLRMELANMRKLAINMIRRYTITDASVYPLLERSYKEGIDMEEKLGAVNALSAIGTDDAARLLSSFLMIINGKLQSGTLTQDDERLVRAVIPALGATGRSAGRPALRAVQTLDWTNAVKNLAAEALKKIQ